MSDAEGRTALTTGANSGIGLATTVELARRGLRSVGGVRSAAKARVVHAAARKAGVDVETVMLDVTDAPRCRRVIDELQPYALINNAGISNLGAIEDVADDDARRQLEIMLVGPMRLARLSLDHMRAQGGGRIVNISSVYGITTTPLSGWYQACKHGLEAASDALRVEVARDGVKVILVEPGGFDTGIWEDSRRSVQRRRGTRYAAAYERTLEGVRMSRPLMGDPAAVARVIGSAVTSSRPRNRVMVGYDAQLARIYSRLVPETVRDRVYRVTLGL